MRTLPVSNQFVRFNNAFKSDEGGQKTSVTEVIETNKKEQKSGKTGQIVTSALALAALVGSGIAIAKNPKKGKEVTDSAKDELLSKINEIEKSFVNKMSELETKLSDAQKNGAKTEINEIKEEISNIKKWYDNWIKDIDSKVKNVEANVRPKTDSYYKEVVNINGRDFTLASVAPENRIGAPRMIKNEWIDDPFGARAKMEKTLQSEALVRMLGLNGGLKEIPKNGMIRIPTSEYKGYASTGGMAIVPKEIAENLSKILAGRQDIQIVVDMPLYLGNVEKSAIKETQTRLFNKLVKNTSTGKYEYIQEKYVRDSANAPEKLSQKSVMARLEKINTLHINDGVGKYDVDVFMAEKELPTDIKYYMDIPGIKDIISNSFRKFDSTLTEAEIELLEKIIPTDSASYAAFKAGEYTKIAKSDLLLNNLSVADKAVLDGLLKNEEFTYNNLIIRKNKLGMSAAVKVKTVFYDNGKGGKFDLDVAEDLASNIYNGLATSSKETERFLFFDKFFYEGLLDQTGNQKLRADAILGNDWQTGGISAMLRQLTTVKKAYGEITPELADSIYNTPVITLMHNAGLSGGNWFMQEELLNIMYGKHTAEIVKNSHMPNLYLPGKTQGLYSTLFNGMMEGQNVNPQMMAVAYSDIIAPVSKGYSNEIATSNIFGGERRELFEFRARMGAYADKNNLKAIAQENKVPTDMIDSSSATMVGIVNGCDRANNTLTEKVADKLAANLGVAKGTFIPYKKGIDTLEWHNHNKLEGLNIVKRDIDIARNSGGKQNPMQIELPEITDLTGVTEKTPVFVSAGRIVDQKGLDIFAASIEEFYKSYKGNDYPVFYIQGIGDEKYKEAILAVKKRVAETNPEAAKRIVFANLFSEAGRYDCSKIISDFSVMPSWYEPCGLSHKEIAQFSGAGSVVNKTGGLAEELEEGVNIIVSEYKPKHNLNEAPSQEELQVNAVNFANALKKAVELHSDEAKYRKMLDSMMSINLDWAREGGPIYEYTALLEKLGVLNHSAAVGKIK